MKVQDTIYIAGHRGLVGSALVRQLESRGYHRLIRRSHDELDLTDQAAVETFFQSVRPDYVFLAAAKVGGIFANDTYPADFIFENLAIQTNVVRSAWRVGVKRLLFLGSSCIYPRDCLQPIKEEYLLTGPLEPTNRAYAIAKIAGIEMCAAFNRQYGTQYLAAMPTNLYGLNDNYDLQNSHVIPALIRKFYEAKVGGNSSVTVWGTGEPRREFISSDELAEACVFLMNLPDDQYQSVLNESRVPLINIGRGEDVTIRELVSMVKDAVDFNGEIVWDTTKPDGTPRKLLDVSRINGLGWRATLALKDGILAALADFQRSRKNGVATSVV